MNSRAGKVNRCRQLPVYERPASVNKEVENRGRRRELVACNRELKHEQHLLWIMHIISHSHMRIQTLVSGQLKSQN